MDGAHSTAIGKYLALYAEPETAFAELVGHRVYACCLVVPAFRECADFVAGYHDAARSVLNTLGHKVLNLVIVNRSVDGFGADENERLINDLCASAYRTHALPASDACKGRAWLLEGEELDLLVVDRSSEGAALPAKGGVGMARKIGADLALALFAQDKLQSSWIFCTDADVQLPTDYFLRGLAHGTHAAGLVFDFEHVASGDPEVDRNTAWYEASLRYLVLGLIWAGSPYAYHPIGSLIAVEARRYAEVRGFPRRAAGEDFYLLNKLAKVGRIGTVLGPRVRIRARPSTRTPFGTGAAIAAANAERLQRIYHPALFEGLRRWLDVLEAAALLPAPPFELSKLVLAQGERARTCQWSESWPLEVEDRLARGLVAYANQPDLKISFGALCRDYAPGSSRRRALHTWFDRFRTLKLMHALRAQGLVDLRWDEALPMAPLVPKGLCTWLGSPTDLALGLRQFETLRRWSLHGGSRVVSR